MDLVRQWWYLRLEVMRGNYELGDEWNAISKRLEAAGVIRPGVPMTRAGAEDLARDCDDILRRQPSAIEPHAVI